MVSASRLSDACHRRYFLLIYKVYGCTDPRNPDTCFVYARLFRCLFYWCHRRGNRLERLRCWPAAKQVRSVESKPYFGSCVGNLEHHTLESNAPNSGLDSLAIGQHCFLRAVMVWLFNNTGKSVFGMVLFHATINISPYLISNQGAHYDPFIACILLTLMVIVIVLLWDSKTLTRYRYAWF